MRGKIFVTVPPVEDVVHVFVREKDREVALTLHSGFIEKLLWGGKVVGLRIAFKEAKPAAVKALVSKAHQTRVAKAAGPKTKSTVRRTAKP